VKWLEPLTVPKRRRRSFAERRGPQLCRRMLARRGPEPTDVFWRGWELALRYERGERITCGLVMRLFNVAAATAKRDLAAMRVVLYGVDFRSHPEWRYGYIAKESA
jgi:hypothetical protein